MKNSYLIFTLILLYISNIQAQYCTNDNRFTEIPVFTDFQVISNTGIVYGNALDYNGQNQNLVLNIYYPNPTIDTFNMRPLIILMHGGSFLGGSLNGLNTTCLEFAKRGFVAATIEYRVGWDYASNCNGDTTSANKAIYRAMQDAHASLRYLVAHASTYRIDTSWIFAGGNSAGAFAIADLAFVNQQEINTRWPFCQQQLGNIDASGNDFTNTFKIKGLFHNWGSIIDIDYLEAADAIPMISFAGELDNISPIDSGYYQNCTNYPFMWGSRSIYNKLLSFGVCAEINVDAVGGHGVYNDTPQQDLFRIQKATCFFKSLFCNNCSPVYFTDSIPASCNSLKTENPQSISDKDEIKVLPNPFSNKINLLNESDSYSYELINQMGQIIWSGKQIELQDFSGIANGLYFLRVNIPKSQNSQKIKLIKQ